MSNILCFIIFTILLSTLIAQFLLILALKCLFSLEICIVFNLNENRCCDKVMLTQVKDK